MEINLKSVWFYTMTPKLNAKLTGFGPFRNETHDFPMLFSLKNVWMSDKSWEPGSFLMFSYVFQCFLTFSIFSNVFQCYLLSFSLSLSLTISLSHSLTLSHSHTLSISHWITLDLLNNFCFHFYAQNSLSLSLSLYLTLTLSHSHTLSISHSITLDMLNKFCFHV